MVPAIGSRNNTKIVTARGGRARPRSLVRLASTHSRLPLPLSTTRPSIQLRASGSNHKGARVVPQPAGDGADLTVLQHVGGLAQHPASPSSWPRRYYA